MSRAWKIILVASLMAVLTIITVTAVITFANIHSTGRVKTIDIEAYDDPALTIPLVEIDWGIMEPDETKSYTFYVYNSGNFPVTLDMWTDTWTPNGTDTFMDFTWNYQEETILSGDSLELQFTLYIHSDIDGIDAFSFDITIEGLG